MQHTSKKLLKDAGLRFFWEGKPDEESPINGKRARLTLSSFFGMLPAKEGEKPKLILWS
jgi:hypothetical protein